MKNVWWFHYSNSIWWIGRDYQLQWPIRWSSLFLWRRIIIVPSSNWLGGHPFKVEIGVRAPVGWPKGIFPIPRSGKIGRGRGDERIALFGNGFLGINCCRYSMCALADILCLQGQLPNIFICLRTSVGRGSGSYPACRWFKSARRHQPPMRFSFPFMCGRGGSDRKNTPPFICQIGQAVKSQVS